MSPSVQPPEVEMFESLRRHPLTKVAMVAIPLLLATPLAMASWRGGWHGCEHHPESPEQALGIAKVFVGQMLDEIEATPKQRQQIEGVLEDSVREGFALRQEAAALRDRVRDALDAGADDATLEALRAESVALFDRGSRVATTRMAEVRRAVTDDQWDELQEIRRERMGDHW